MSAFVFVGPTLPTAEVQACLDCFCLGPVAQGDVYRATLRRPKAIAIIDGYFDHICSVWHKEILWALRQGVHVLGSSSMGALRAAELDQFGMVGVGAIYEAYRNGTLEDDDEVAVLHGPEESTYTAATDAMVNIRATLKAAGVVGILRPATAQILVRIAKDLHYTERRYSAVLDAARSDPMISSDEIERFAAWLPSGRVDQKREDALALLDCLRVVLEEDPPIPPIAFEYTTLFDDLRRRAGELDFRPASQTERLLTDAILDEARLAGLWPELKTRATARRLALEDARRQRLVLQEHALLDKVIEMREARDLVEPEDLERWLETNNLRGSDFVALMEDEVLLRRVVDGLEPELGADILDLLRLDGAYAALADRALAKRAFFAAIDFDPPETAAYDEARHRLCSGLPVQDAMRTHGFRSIDEFDRAAIGELFYVSNGGRSSS